MRNRFRSVFCVACVMASLLPATSSDAGDSDFSVLVVGNALTRANDMPNILKKVLQREDGLQIKLGLQTHSKTLRDHWAGGRTPAAIESHPWKLVILHEDGYLAARSPQAAAYALNQFQNLTLKKGSRTLVLLPWLGPGKKKELDALTKLYLRTIGRREDVRLAPVGLAWQIALEANPHLLLHADEQRTPTKLGSYLTACVLYSVITNKSPVGIYDSNVVLDTTTLKAIQTAAWNATQEFAKLDRLQVRAVNKVQVVQPVVNRVVEVPQVVVQQPVVEVEKPAAIVIQSVEKRRVTASALDIGRRLEVIRGIIDQLENDIPRLQKSIIMPPSGSKKIRFADGRVNKAWNYATASFTRIEETLQKSDAEVSHVTMGRLGYLFDRSDVALKWLYGTPYYHGTELRIFQNRLSRLSGEMTRLAAHFKDTPHAVPQQRLDFVTTP